MALSSRERVLLTIDGRPTDYAPLSMLLFSELRRRCGDDEDEIVRRQVELGTDPLVPLGEPPIRPHRDVRTDVWEEPAAPNPLLHKRYRTPAGDLETVVEKTADWPHGRDVPLVSDYVIPRARKFLVTGPADLGPLAFLLADPDAGDVADFRRGAAEARRLAERYGLALRGGFNRLSDMICWLAGCEALATLGRSDPAFLQALVNLLAAWQERRIELILSAQPDLLVDAQWYATTFLSPALYERFLSPALGRRVAMAHQAGARFCAVATTNVLPFAGCLKRLGIDALFGVDPIQGGWDLARAKAELGDQVCLWGGVNGYLTIVDGSPEAVEKAVEDAMASLATGGRFILAPVDDVRIDADDADAAWPRVWQNVARMVKAWKRLR